MQLMQLLQNLFILLLFFDLFQRSTADSWQLSDSGANHSKDREGRCSHITYNTTTKSKYEVESTMIEQ